MPSAIILSEDRMEMVDSSKQLSERSMQSVPASKIDSVTEFGGATIIEMVNNLYGDKGSKQKKLPGRRVNDIES